MILPNLPIGRLLEIINSIHNGIVAVDEEGRILLFNKAMEKIYRCPAEEAIGKQIKRIIPSTGMYKVLKTGQLHIGRKFYHDNKMYLVNRTPIFSEGQTSGAVSVIQEITELQSVLQELQSVKDLMGTLETILQSAYDGLIVVNTQGLVNMVNDAFCSLFEVQSQECLGKHVLDIIENSKLHFVAANGKAEKSDLIIVKGKEVLVMQIPIVKEGVTIGALGKFIYKDLNELNALALKVNALHSELVYYRDEVQKFRSAKYGLDNIIGHNAEISRLRETIKRVALTNSTVLIRGETGTGKELVAHALHMESGRKYGPFIKVNCAAIPEQLLESELFGYDEGAFTGAKKRGQIGKFELADGGTIFLDEIGDLPLPLQSKLLRVLQEKEIERLGSGKAKKIDVRVVVATNQILEDLIKKGRFREDLFYRLNVVTLSLPPLRERKEDLDCLVEHFIAKFNREFSVTVNGMAPSVWNLFRNYHWPGNVRELENVIERAFNVVEGNMVLLQDLPSYLRKFTQSSRLIARPQALQALLEQTEKAAIKEVLNITEGNKAQAAKLLGISRAWLYRKISQYNLED
ncbi:MAG: sigma 54-interacting transcriptional regulator [Bacillota bacterium]